MTSRPLVSVLIPFYETPPAFLREAVESALAQSYLEREVLLVDDGSRGPAAEAARELAARHPGEIRLLAHPGGANRGVMATRRLGLEAARGELVALLDADDVWLPGKLQEQVERLHAHPRAGAVYGNSLYWHGWSGRAEDARRDWVPPLGFAEDQLVEPPELLPRFLEGTAAVPVPSSVLARAAVLRKTGAFDDAFPGVYEDQVTYAKLALETPILVAAACWDRYRQHPASTCGAIEPAAERAYRGAFLDWLEGHLVERGVSDARVWGALRRERWRLRHPGLARALRLAGRATRRWRRRRA